MNLLAYLVVILHFAFICSSMENNVCPTYEDYRTMKNNSNCWYDFSAALDVMGMIKGNGYPAEVHKVKTEDRYILTVFRIPNHHVQNPTLRKGPVFLQHGWLNSAAVFVAHGKDSLAFALADAGYDVWLGNFRGTEYSEEHVNLTVFDKEYWDYSADEIGLYDIPTQLELVAERTGQRGNIVYIGHSLGTTAGLIYGSSYPQLARSTVKLFVLLAPAANLSHMRSLFFRILGPFFGMILRRANEAQFIRLISQGSSLKRIIQLVCLESPVLMKRCMQIVNLLVSGPRTQMEPSMIPVFLNHIPAGTSFKVSKHIADFAMNRFRRYNHGFLKNIQKYGRIFPPEYDVSKIEVPVFVMYAVGDWACSKEDSLILYNKLCAMVRYGIYEITEPNFNHLDFCFGRDAKRLVNEPLLSVLQQINTPSNSVT